MPRYVIAIVAVVALGAAYWLVAPFFGSAPHAAGPSALRGSQAPVFQLHDDRGRAVSLDAYRGRIVLMNLWASWCPPCRAEMPDLQRLANAYAARGVAVIGVNEGESPQRAQAFADSLRIRFPIWIDGEQRYGRVYTALGLPTTVILDGRGSVVRGFDGPLTYAQMQAAIVPLVQTR